MRTPQIYCPRCAWHPSAASRWVCARRIGGCGHVWNTFDTRGVCPKCRWKWEIAACLSCRQFSLHEARYHDPEPPRAQEVEEDTDREVLRTTGE
jgi:hypothetical protein